MSIVRNFGSWSIDTMATSLRRAQPAQKTSIGYIGWTRKGNLGDEVMREAACSLFAPQRLEIFAGARRERMLHRFRLSGSHTFHKVYLGGGTLINDGYLGVVECALALGLPVSSLGTGAGSAGFETVEEGVSPAWREALMRFQNIGVRGPRSLAKLEAIGIRNSAVVGDLALALTPDVPAASPEAKCFLFNAARPSQPQPGFPAETVFKALVKAARQMKDLGWTVCAVAFSPNDVEPTKTTLREAGFPAVKIHQPKTFREFLRLAKGASCSIGVRLHCAVLSSCAGVAPLGVAYCEKGLDFADSMGLSGWLVDITDIGGDALTARAEVLVCRASELGTAAHARALAWRQTLRSYAARDAADALVAQRI